MDDKQMRDTEITNERNLVLRRGQQMRRVVGSQHSYRMRIERDDDGSASRRPGMFRRSRNHRLVAEMNAVENADGEIERAAKLGQLGDRSQHAHRLVRRRASGKPPARSESAEECRRARSSSIPPP